MASSEKPTTKILVTVAGGLILAALLYIARHWLPVALHWTVHVFSAGWDWFTSSHAVPGWLLMALLVCGVWCFSRMIAAFRSPPKPVEPHWNQFTEFESEGVLWRWSFDSNGGIHNLVSFCPKSGCDMQIYGVLAKYYGPGNESTCYKCDRCGNESEINGIDQSIEDRVIREIQRLLRTNEWRKHIRSHAS